MSRSRRQEAARRRRRRRRLLLGSLLGSLLGLLLLLVPASGEQPREDSSPACGGHLTARRGVISTPNFPGPFPVPLHCRWVLDGSALAEDPGAANASIIVHLTQLYAYRGLSFTEYAYYESEAASFGPSLLREVDEGNVLELRWLRTYRPYLVVEFRLDRLEGSHVRVLDRLLDVYGFNITYEMSDLGYERPAGCSLSECSFAGNCLLAADYATFYCDCFEGFGGEHCSHGPLCVSERGNPICQNGGTCRHIGAAAVRCSCPPQFSGDFCEILDVNEQEMQDCREAADCIFQCPFPGDQQQQQQQQQSTPQELQPPPSEQQQQQQRRWKPCHCKEPIRVRSDRTRFECRIKLTNVTHPRPVDLVQQNVSLENHLSKLLSKYIWQSNISSMEDMKILSITSALEVNFHFFGNSADGDKIREALNRLVQRRRFGEFSLEPSHFTFQQKPAVRLKTLRINQVNGRQIQLGDQFILSCEAVGSTDLKFSWYKDGMVVNMSKATREIWYRHLPNDGSDYHTSILSVEKAQLLDAGVFTCQVIDWGVQQCKSIRISVKDDPNVRVVPMSSTVDRGSTVRLVCTTPNMRSIGIGFGWTKNRALLRLEPGQEVWEDLYPAGSILTISRALKSAVYTCNVAHRSSSVRVEVVNRTLIPLCRAERAWGLGWPETAPGSRALLPCPAALEGRHVGRQCSMRNASSSEWQLPDFSGCLYEPLLRPYHEFRSLTLGYESTKGSWTIQAFWDVLQYRRSALYPGEGDRIISLLEEVEHYQYTLDELDDLRNSAEALMRIVDKILSNSRSILSQQKLVSLSQLVHRNLGYWSQDSNKSHKHLSLAEVVVDVLPMKVYSSSTIMYSLKVPQDNQSLQISKTNNVFDVVKISQIQNLSENNHCKTSIKYPDWYNERVTIRLYGNRAEKSNKSAAGIVVVYRNLGQFFPDTYITELEDGTDLEYRISSRVVSVATSHRSPERDDRFTIELEFAGARNRSSSSSSASGSGNSAEDGANAGNAPLEAWNASCGSLRPDGDWSLDSCSLLEPAHPEVRPDALRCLCSNPGTFAAFVTARAETVILAKSDDKELVVILGCGSCLVQCLLAILVLSAFWWRNRSWLNFLKIQCCAAIVAAMATFIYAVHSDVPEDNLSIVAMCLEAFLLIGTSSPISQALIIYAELSNIHPSQQLQPTVVAVITGVPILALLTTELMRKTVGWKHESWWLIFGTEVYNIFVVCSITLLLTFLLLYIAVIYKTRPLLYRFTKKDVIQHRVKTLHHSAVVIFGIVAMEVSSVLFVNSPSLIYQYVFAFQSAFLGLITLSMYVISGEVLVVAPVLHKLKRQSETDDECASEQTKVRSKDREAAERELSSSSSAAAAAAVTAGATLLLSGVCDGAPTGLGAIIYPEPRGVAVGIDAREYVNEAAAGAYAAATKTLPEIQIHHVDDIHLENYAHAHQLQQQQQQQLQQHHNRLQQQQHQHHQHHQHQLQLCQRRFEFQEQQQQQQPSYVVRATNFAQLESYATLEHVQQHQPQTYKELVSLTGLEQQHQLQQQQQRVGPTGATLLCSAQVETCLGGRALLAPTMPDVTLAVNGEAAEPGAQRKQLLGAEAPAQAPGPSGPEPARPPDVAANTAPERRQPDGEAAAPGKPQRCRRERTDLLEEAPPSGPALPLLLERGLPANGVLDRISHDLDYLLNRTKEDA